MAARQQLHWIASRIIPRSKKPEGTVSYMQTLFSFVTAVKGWLLAFNVISLPKEACSCDYIDNNNLVTLLLRQ